MLKQIICSEYHSPKVRLLHSSQKIQYSNSIIQRLKHWTKIRIQVFYLSVPEYQLQYICICNFFAQKVEPAFTNLQLSKVLDKSIIFGKMLMEAIV